MIDAEGFRANVGIILVNDAGRVFWGRRVGQNAWQFPQGGIKHHESPQQALFRELHEEIGLTRGDVEILGVTRDWLRYLIPRRYLRRDRPPCIGQKQRWYLLRLTAGEERIRLDADDTPEFDAWRWVDYWTPLTQIVTFKREVYRLALEELAGCLPQQRSPQPLPQRA
ncbi:RNA pyrophosphohydrolase [Immundisolibacter sp.]|uniref:RNA pyrophosphohydrolase n=1 Tax=Immundisolibacter sp. TaxID=1934948 RepID=UPI00261C6FCA|nr:RNA pyrophosphohydrolase [Immundisolibacter sp.]MDD3649920.1 RNA pyrophosphohydrolase [Immundisolibacter sp.]